MVEGRDAFASAAVLVRRAVSGERHHHGSLFDARSAMSDDAKIRGR